MQFWTISITEQKKSLYFTPAAKEADKSEERKWCDTFLALHYIFGIKMNLTVPYSSYIEWPVCTQEVAVSIYPLLIHRSSRLRTQ